tara:strand:+ start:98 stop:289 length:192 start_codon:yes stop_codon:yes gene_type:complete
MDQVTVKRQKKGWLISVPESQYRVFSWILTEGEAGLSACYEDEGEPIVIDGDLDNWNGIKWDL